MAQNKNQDQEFSVSADKIQGNRKEYFRKKGFFYYLMRWVPLLIIAVVVGLMIAHFRGYPVYDKILTPAMIKLGIMVPQEEEALPPAGDPVAGEQPADLQEPEGTDPSMNLPLPGEINED